MTETELVEALSDKVHASWARYMEYFFSKCLAVRVEMAPAPLHVPGDYVAAIRRQINTPYAALTEAEKDSDRQEAREFLALVREYADGLTAEALQVQQAGARVRHATGGPV